MSCFWLTGYIGYRKCASLQESAMHAPCRENIDCCHCSVSSVSSYCWQGCGLGLNVSVSRQSPDPLRPRSWSGLKGVSGPIKASFSVSSRTDWWMPRSWNHHHHHHSISVKWIACTIIHQSWYRSRTVRPCRHTRLLDIETYNKESRELNVDIHLLQLANCNWWYIRVFK